jgi:1,2-diacylglycerol 3-alpha-glucosyltransferase
MRVGFFTDSYRPNLNGVVVSIETFAAALAKSGSSVVLFAPHPQISRRLDTRLTTSTDPLPPGITQIHLIPSLPLLTERNQRLALPIERSIQRRAAAAGIDVVHTHTPFAIGYAGVQAGRALGVPLVHTYHTYYAEYAHYLKAGARIARRVTPTYSRWFCNLHDRVLAPSRDIQGLLVRYGVRRPIEVMMTGVQIPPEALPGDREAARKRLGVDPSARALLFVGRIAREKNLDLLLDSLLLLRRKLPAAFLLLAGDGPDRARLEREVRARRLGPWVRFLGWVPHDRIQSIYLAADLFVSSSVTETQGLAPLEAMAAGRAVVVAEGPGVVDLIDNGHSGIIVDPDAASLAAAAERVLTDSGLAEGLGRNARERARGIEAHEQANRLLIRYDALRLSARRSRRGLRGLATRAREEVAAWR